MKTVKIEINRENKGIETFGFAKDGAIHFGECGLDNELSDEEFIEFFKDRHEDYNVEVVFV